MAQNEMIPKMEKRPQADDIVKHKDEVIDQDGESFLSTLVSTLYPLGLQGMLKPGSGGGVDA